MDRGGAFGVGARADAGAKTVTFTVPGPFSGDIKLPRQSFWIRSMSITNNTDATMFLSDTLYPVTNANAALRIPSRTMYEVHDWSNDTIFVGLSAALLTGDWITFQMSDHLTPLSSAPLPAGVGFPFSADNFVWDGAAWQRWVQVPAADGAAATGIGAVGGMLFNGATWDRAREAALDGIGATGVGAVAVYVLGSTFNRLKEASGDGLSSAGLPVVGPMILDPGTLTWDRPSSVNVDSNTNRGRPGVLPLVYNSVAGAWDRVREPTADGMAVTGLPGAAVVVFDGTNWSRLRSPAADASAVTGLPGVLPMVWNGATWDRWKEPTADAQAPTGLGGVAPAIFNPSSGLWDRLRGVGADGLGGAGLLTNQPTLLNGAAFDRARSASAANLAAQSGLGVALAAQPGHWFLSSSPGGGVVASATRAAVAGTRHVLTELHATIEDVGAAANIAVTLLVRDGAAGVGPVVYLCFLIISGAGAAFNFDRVFDRNLSIVGSVNTAMTVEFNAIAAGFQEAVWAGGYDTV